MYLVYNLLLTLLAPIWGPWMWWRTRQRKESPNWAERQGLYANSIPVKAKNERRIWVHAVSVGEVIAAKPFLRELRRQKPKVKIVLSVTTSSGHQTAREQASDLFDHLVYFPIDAARFQLRAMQRVRPDVIAIMETELWFNFLWSADVFKIPTYVVNGRCSDRAFRRSMKFRWFFRSMLGYVQQVLVQTQVDNERFESLGATNVEVVGNTKFDEIALDEPADSSHWRQELGIPADRPVVVVGSTRSEMEEDWVLQAFFENTGAVFVHAPRHIESANRIVEQFHRINQSIEKFERTNKQPPLAIGRRSDKTTGDYIVLDSYGELGSVYEVADLVVIGGGFDKLGGQNLIQPLALGKPVLHGPHMFNFREAAASAVEAEASISCQTPAELSQQIETLLAQPERRRVMGEKALALVQANIGASRRYAEKVCETL
jgi:3-deoxy-D-manno-octulosonic-acid transferase